MKKKNNLNSRASAAKKNNNKVARPVAKMAAKKAAPAFKRPKGKIPALGSGMMGLGATGAQGMMP